MAEERPRADMRFYFWLPKTAGGTIANGIRRHTNVKWLDYPRPDVADALSATSQIWMGGHHAYGLDRIYNSEPIYLTVLREPIERMISEFFYHHSHKQPDIYIPDDELIPAFTRLVETAAHLNYYSYMFSDYCFAKESIEAGQGPWNGNIFTAHDLILRRDERLGFLVEKIPFQDVNIETTFQRASKNILNMSFIGLFDRLSDTTAYLKAAFGLDVGLATRSHETRWCPAMEDLPGHIQAMLKNKTQADSEFFHSTRPVAMERARSYTKRLGIGYRIGRARDKVVKAVSKWSPLA